MQIDRLDRIAAGRVHDVVGLGELYQLAEVFMVAGAAAAITIGDEGRAGDLGEDEIVAADRDVARRVAGVHREGRRHGGDHVHDQPAVEAHSVGAGRHVGADGLHPVACFRQDDVHADLFEDGQRRVMDRFERIFRKHRGLCQRIDKIEIFSACGLAGPLSAAATWPASPLQRGRGRITGCCIGKLIVVHEGPTVLPMGLCRRFSAAMARHLRQFSSLVE
ncbi:hypothetical protein D9M70_516980 [compost metagenome]